MNGLKVLISPLNWGFGHAGRMIPLAQELQRRGCEVFFAADPLLLQMVEMELPGVKLIEIPGLTIRYSRRLPQYICIFLQLPVLITAAVREHRDLRRLAAKIRPSVIISDNRFGFWHNDIFSVYVTHQVRIAFPRSLGWLEPIAAWLHRLVIKRYDLCLVPDCPGEVNLSGRLSHGGRMPERITYTGPLSRFAQDDTGKTVETSHLPQKYACLILSGPEPQRSILLEKVTGTIGRIHLAVLTATPVEFPCGPEVQLITSPSTATMREIISGASLVVARAGYTSVMELASLGMGAVLVPTPGQTEQEYLGRHLDGRFGFVTMKQDKLGKLAELAEQRLYHAGPEIQVTKSADFSIVKAAPVTGTPESLPDPAPLLEKAIEMLLENNKE